ncbi:MAG: hypothetical protein ABFR90_00285 [Planctomycetota bacterium]
MKITKITILTALFSILTSSSLSASAIEEGFMMDGVSGLLKKEPKEDLWTFTPDEAVMITEKIAFPAGTPLQMLPCSVLEQMTGLADNNNEIRVQLWALFTKYEHTNYLFSVSFLPIQNDTVQPTDDASDETDKDKPEPDEADGESIIPKNILQQIKSNETPDLKKFQQIAKVTGDVNLIGRAGYLSEEKHISTFRPDAFGMKVNKKEFQLLPNSSRAAAEKEMARIPGKQRYNVSGLVTQYKGQTYILLTRTSRTYTHGNFTP